MYKNPWLALVFVLLIGDQLHAMQRSVGNVGMSPSKLITAYLLRQGTTHPHWLEIWLEKNDHDKWSGIQTAYDVQDDREVLFAGLEHLHNEGITGIRGAVLVNSLGSSKYGKKCLVRLSDEHQMTEIDDTQGWFPVDKLSGSRSIPEEGTLCTATRELLYWRGMRVKTGAKDPLRILDQ